MKEQTFDGDAAGVLRVEVHRTRSGENEILKAACVYENTFGFHSEDGRNDLSCSANC